MKKYRLHIQIIIILALAGLFLVFLRPVELWGDTYFMIAYGGSMQPAINVGDLAIIKHMDPSQIHLADMLTFYQSHQIVTHRVVEILPNGDFVTKGDANNAPDIEPVSKSQVIGKVIFIIPYVGYVLHYAGSFWGLIFLVWIPACVLVVMELKKILKTKRKRKPVIVRACCCMDCGHIFQTARVLAKDEKCRKCGGKLKLINKFKSKKIPRDSGRKMRWVTRSSPPQWISKG